MHGLSNLFLNYSVCDSGLRIPAVTPDVSVLSLCDSEHSNSWLYDHRSVHTPFTK